MKQIEAKVISRNISIVLLVQVVSTIVSFVMGFIVPKFISTETYSWWQVYMLYVNYSALFQFGLFDGFLLRYSKFDYDELDTKKVRSQFYLYSLALDLIALIIMTVTVIVSKQSILIVLLIIIGIIMRNFFRYVSYTLQATNEIKEYSIMTLLERVSYVLFVIVFLFFKSENFYLLCICDVLGTTIALIYGVVKRPALFFGKLEKKLSITAKEFAKNISTGIFVTIAAFSFSFLITGAKTVVQWHWDELTFGQVSFSISIMNVFLTFITSASVVLLPSIKRMRQEDLPLFYGKMREILSIILFCGLVLYFPVRYILSKWLPDYVDGLYYVGLILPSVIFSSKVNLLTNNYLKSYFKERILLLINILTMAISIVLFCISAYVFNNLYFILYSINILCFINSLLAEVIVSKIINISLVRKYIQEIFMAVAFIIVVILLPNWIAFIVYSMIVLLYLCINHKSVSVLFLSVKEKLKSKKISS